MIYESVKFLTHFCQREIMMASKKTILFKTDIINKYSNIVFQFIYIYIYIYIYIIYLTILLSS